MRVRAFSYAGTLNAFPDYARQTRPLTLDMLANDEFEDEFWVAPPGKKIRTGSSADYSVEHELPLRLSKANVRLRPLCQAAVIAVKPQPSDVVVSVAA